VRPTDLHRVFIQTMLARRFARDEVGLELYRRAVNAVRGALDYQSPFTAYADELDRLIDGYRRR